MKSDLHVPALCAVIPHIVGLFFHNIALKINCAFSFTLPDS